LFTILSHKINLTFQHIYLAPNVDIREIHWHILASTEV